MIHSEENEEKERKKKIQTKYRNGPFPSSNSLKFRPNPHDMPRHLEPPGTTWNHLVGEAESHNYSKYSILKKNNTNS